MEPSLLWSLIALERSVQAAEDTCDSHSTIWRTSDIQEDGYQALENCIRVSSTLCSSFRTGTLMQSFQVLMYKPLNALRCLVEILDHTSRMSTQIF